MMTGLVVLKIVLMPSSTRLASAANSGPRWSMIGVSIARRMRSGSGVGPGICKKWRPTVREAFLDISFSLAVLLDTVGNRAAAPGRRAKRANQAGACGVPQLAAMKDECETQSSLLRSDLTMTATLLPGLERRLRAALAGEVRFDRFTRGRYATDASHYQIMPLGVVLPRSVEDAEGALRLAREEGVTVLPRGGGTSQAGQTVNQSLVIDCSKYLDHLIELDVAGRRFVVEPGIVLDELNRRLRPHGLWFPVDISTSSRATIGGMVGNNSCGARSLRYGNTRENVLSIDAVLADGSAAHFGPAARDLSDLPPASPLLPLARDLLALAAREADEIEARFPKLQRRVGGYNLDALVPGRNDLNLAHLLVGSEGTLAFSTRVELKLSSLLGARAVGACHFGSFFQAMDAAQHIVKLGPIAVELIDRTMLGLAREIAMFRPTIDAVVRGDPEAVLFVEFAEDDSTTTSAVS